LTFVNMMSEGVDSFLYRQEDDMHGLVDIVDFADLAVGVDHDDYELGYETVNDVVYQDMVLECDNGTECRLFRPLVIPPVANVSDESPRRLWDGSIGGRRRRRTNPRRRAVQWGRVVKTVTKPVNRVFNRVTRPVNNVFNQIGKTTGMSFNAITKELKTQFDNQKISIMAGPFEISTTGGIKKPDFHKWKFGAEGKNFQLSAGISDIREGFFVELNAKVMKAFTVESTSLAGFIAECAREGIKMKDSSGLISSMASKAMSLVPRIKLMSISSIKGVATVSNGQSHSRGVAVGLVSGGFRWFGSTIAIKNPPSIVDFRVGIHDTSSKYRLKISYGDVSIDAIVTCAGQTDWSYYARHCSYWRGRGFCRSGNRYYGFMHHKCKKTCQCF